MKRIAIGVLILGVIVVVALSTRRRLPQVEEANGTAAGAVAAVVDSSASSDAGEGSRGPEPRAGQVGAGDAGARGAVGDPDVAGPDATRDSAASATASTSPAGESGADAGEREADEVGASSQLPSTERILERASAAYADVRSMQAEFAMTMTNPLLRRTTNSRGMLYQRRPDRIALRFTDPQGDVIVGDGTHFWVYYPSVDEKQVIRMPASQGASGGVDLQSQFVGDPTERFRSTLHGTESVDGREAYVLTLEPRGAANYTALKVWLDTRDYLARRFEIVEESGAVRRFDLTDLRTNVNLGDATFRFTPPADARIVDRG